MVLTVPPSFASQDFFFLFFIPSQAVHTSMSPSSALRIMLAAPPPWSASLATAVIRPLLLSLHSCQKWCVLCVCLRAEWVPLRKAHTDRLPPPSVVQLIIGQAM